MDHNSHDIFVVLAQNLKEQRKKKLLSQEQLADLANLDRTYISLIETGKRNPSLSTIVDLADILQINVTDLLIEAKSDKDLVAQFCAEYSINPESLVSILRDPKVIPMIRGKAFEFIVKEKLEHILQNSYNVSNPFLNPQSGTDKTDVQIIRRSDQKAFRVECKLAEKGKFTFKTKSKLYQLRVKCMRSRTLGEEASVKIAKKTSISSSEHSIHKDQYLPSDFDLVVTSIENSFFATDEIGSFVWKPPQKSLEFLRLMNINNSSDAFHKIYVARSSDLAALVANQIICTRKTCKDKTICGFIPNSPMINFDSLGKVQKPWYSLDQIESLLT